MTKLNSLYNAFIKQAFSDLIITDGKNRKPLYVDQGYHYTVTGKYLAIPPDLYPDEKSIRIIENEPNMYGDHAVEPIDKHFNKKFNDLAIKRINESDMEDSDDYTNAKNKRLLFKEHKRVMNYLSKNKTNRFHLA